jgi:tagaturonate reductase
VHLLNGAHSLLAPIALAMGIETVVDAMNVPALNQFVCRVMLDEIVPTLNVDGAKEFAGAVADRFANPFIRHALIDITLQATMKIRVRVVPTIERFVAANEAIPPLLTFGFAAFLLFMQGSIQDARRAQGLAVPVDDQGARLHSLWNAFPNDTMKSVNELVSTICRDITLWGTDLTVLPGFTDAVANDISRIRSCGISDALNQLVTT